MNILNLNAMTKEQAIKHIVSLPDDAKIQIGRNYNAEAEAEIYELIDEIKSARQQASNPNIIDTMGTTSARTLLYVKGICQRFVEKHEKLTMI